MADKNKRKKSGANSGLNNDKNIDAELVQYPDLIFQSEVMQKLLQQLRRVAVMELPILLQGESGTGKDVLARIIHQTSSRKNGPFICVNCGAIPENLVEAELFGHERGAFTGAITARKGYIAESHQGTLFLDEIGELPLSTQVKLLRVIQDSKVTAVGSVRSQTVDFRIISATNRNLLHEVYEGRFRNDLFHRLVVAMLLIPPLRERPDDLEKLVSCFLEGVGQIINTKKLDSSKKREISDHALRLLHQHSWPGNIRELNNTLLRAMLLSDGTVIKAKDIQGALFPVIEDSSAEILGHTLNRDFRLTSILTKVADHYFNKAMRESGGNKAEATRLLGLNNPTTFNNWVKKYPWNKQNG
ncbi:MAG: sigma-54-dependent Fis family transcriptional regulator [Magnetococcales bacterium]|nr:sigma-54-dependent Fis family transcriptional regulator [Magnetococcales bacterium]